MDDKTTSASLRAFTDETDLKFISEALGVAPTKQGIKGELRRKRNLKSSVFEKSVWIYDSGLPDTCELHKQIESLLKVVELNRVPLAGIRHRIDTFDIFCMFSSEHGQGSVELNAELLRRLGELNLDVIIDLYPPN
jgi:hypothetical protein